MKLSYDFDQFEPPHLTSQTLQLISQQRRLARRALALIIASNLMSVCLILVAFYVAPFSLAAGIACLTLLGLSLSGSGVIAVLFAKNWSVKFKQPLFRTDLSITY